MCTCKKDPVSITLTTASGVETAKIDECQHLLVADWLAAKYPDLMLVLKGAYAHSTRYHLYRRYTKLGTLTTKF